MRLSLSESSPEPIAVCYSEPTWMIIDNKMKVDLPSKLTKLEPGEVLRQEFLALLNDRYQEYTKIYTDGSVDLKESKSGAGYYIQTGESYFIPCSSVSSLDAELLAINASLMQFADGGSEHLYTDRLKGCHRKSEETPSK